MSSAWSVGDRVSIIAVVMEGMIINGKQLVQIEGATTPIIAWLNPEQFSAATMDSDDPRSALHDDWHGGG